jgi:anti-sigma B factor antagonist
MADLLPPRDTSYEAQPSPPVGFFAEVRHEPGVVVSVTGEIDLATGPALQRRLSELLCLPLDSLTVDMAGVEFMDSSGLRVLNRTRIDADERNIPFGLKNVPRQARRILEITGMIDVLPMDRDGRESNE